MRRASAVLAAVLVAGCGGDERAPSPTAPPTTATQATPRVDTSALRRLERRADARIGVYAVDTGDGRVLAHRADTRFAYASTFKALLAGAILRSDRDLGATRSVTTAALAGSYAPITAPRVGSAMSLRALADAAVRHSDNGAANLLLDELGGPPGLDAALEALGDTTTRPVRREPALNDWAPGEARDTSTPRALATTLRALVLGDALADDDRRTLTGWLRRNTTGDALVRAAVPRGWVVGDKTGTGTTYGTRNDLAVVWPPGRAPLVLAILTRGTSADAEPRDALVRRAAEIVLDEL